MALACGALSGTKTLNRGDMDGFYTSWSVGVATHN